MDNRFTGSDKHLDWLAICINQKGLVALVTQVQDNNKLLGSFF